MKSQLIEKILQSVASRRSSAGALMNPVRDWVIGIFTALLVLVAGLLYASYFFWYRVHAVPEGNTVGTELTSYEKEKVDETLRLYSDRKKRFETLRGEVGFGPVIPISDNELSTSDEALNPD
jgi:hypothetical protein